MIKVMNQKGIIKIRHQKGITEGMHQKRIITITHQNGIIKVVTAHEGIRFAQKHRLKSRRENGWMHSLTSAKTGYNVSELFNGLYEEIFETFGNTLAKKHAWEPQEKVLFDIPISQPSPRKKCC